MARAALHEIGRVLWLVPIAMTVNDIFVSVSKVKGNSMSPTLNPTGNAAEDLVVIDRLKPKMYKYDRGDVVIVRSPVEPGRLLVKRLIGLQGDWITVPSETKLRQIPQGHCWIEGDNKGNSEDSASHFGSVPLALVEGRVLGVLWPPRRMGTWVRRHEDTQRVVIKAS
mmetsp:Transcript_103/g.156  ORF Transcript_103/g.156 Transcript_103/m.156 type:complete len:168 (+) Transcript_103:186-689(+)